RLRGRDRQAPRGRDRARLAVSTWAEAGQLSRRSLVGMARQPSTWVPGLFFPFMLAAVYSSQFSRAVNLPAFPFPDGSFLEFILVGSVLQGVSFGSLNAATSLALDLENGFMDRLLAAPVPRAVILVGRLAGGMGFAAIQAIVLTVVFVVMGADIRGGPATLVVLVVVSALLALGLGALGAAVALRTGSQEVVQSIFPLVFIGIFVSSAFFPVELMEGWYAEAARRNPMTWIIDPTRELTVTGFEVGAALRAIGIAAALAVVGVAVAFYQLRRRMRNA
ncbi:MAG: ABC transporter permease, partial [Acidimicrobiales bacterium]